jgi:hypothetical protein
MKSLISLSGTSKSQINSPAESKIPLNHRDLYEDRVEKQNQMSRLDQNPA